MDLAFPQSPAMPTLRCISSMATRALLADLIAAWPEPVELVSVGGVDAARRVREGEAFDLVLLAEDALQALAAEGHVQPETLRGLADSDMGVAIPAGRPRPDISTEAALRASVLAAGRIGYSTGPSGKALLQRFEAWGLADELRPRLLQAPAGVPVARLVAEAQVDLGFQQLSELLGQPGIDLLGTLPPEVAVRTRFSAALGRAAQPGSAQLLEHFCGAAAAPLKHQHGMSQPT
jgi:molybdate transport system substrate-binding protein